MTLEEQLAMATGTVAEPSQPVTTAEVQTQPVVNTAPVNTVPVNEAQIQAQAQVVQPTQTAMPQPVQGVQTIQVNTMPTQGYVAPMTTPTYQASMPTTANGVEQIQFGQQINTSPLDLIKKMETGSSFRFTVLNTTGAGLVKFHYSEGLGKFACFSTNQHLGQCCKDLGEPKVRYYLPVMVYPTMPNDLNTIIPNATPTLKVLTLWDADAFDTIAQTIFANNNDLNVDFTAKCTDSYGRLRIDVARGQSFRPQIESFIQQANQTWEQYKDIVPAKIRKNMDEQQYLHVNNQVANNPANYNNTPDNYQNYNGIW